MKSLNDEIDEVKNDTTKIGDSAPKVRSLFDVVKQGSYSADDFIKAKAEEKQKTAPEFKARKWIKFQAGLEDGIHEMSKTAKDIQIWAGQSALAIGGIAGSEKIEEFGKSLIKSAYGEAQAKDKKYMQSAIPLNPSEYNDFTYALGGGVANYGGMLAIAYLTGGASKLIGMSTKAAGIATEAGGIGSMFAMELGGKAQDKIDTYIQKSGDVELKDYTADIADKDFMYSAMYAAGSAILEKKFGFGQQTKLFKMPFGEKFKNVLKTAVSEGGTEFTQSLYETGIDWVGGYIDSSKLPERFMQAVMEGAVGGALGGTAGIAAAINHRSQAKAILKEELQNTIPEKDLDNTVDAIFEESDGTMRSVIAQELIQSEELRNKHGDLYNQIRDKIDLQAKITGAYENIDESQRAQYLSETAKVQADQILAEANRRNVTIDDVVKATDIRMVDGAVYLTPLTQKDIIVNQEVQKIKKKRVYNPERMSLLAYLKYKGGIKDVGGELKARDAGKQMIGLINNKSGVSFDDATLDAWESGYLPQFSERPTINDLLDAIDTSLAGKRIYRESYKPQIEKQQAKEKAVESESRLDEYLKDFVSQKDLDSMSLADKQKYYDDIQDQANLISEEEYVQQELDSLSEDEEERYAIMRENGATHEEAMDEIVKGRVSKEIDELDNEYFQIADENARLDDIYPEYKGETINIDGQEKTVYNSNGKRIAKSEQALRNFYKWFGDSKVVDEQSRPLVVYHGTRTRFSNFDKTKKGQASSVAKVGFWFSPSEQFGYNFAKDLWYGEEDALVMPVYLNLQNPKIYKSGEATEAEIKAKKEIYDEAKKKLSDFNKEYDRIAEEKGYYEAYTFRYSVDVDKLEKDFRYAKDELHAIQKTDAYEKFKQDVYRIDGQPVGNATVGGLGMALNDYSSPQKLAEKLKDEGYDGIIIENTEYDASNITNAKVNTQYVAFEPNQIKSTSNRGTYSESENIYYQSAFAGSRVDYDRPSLEAIGSGEGNQAHGWGLYYALNKDVAEGYRDRFTAYKNNIAFNDKTYTYGEDSEYVVLQELKDKEKTIEQLKEEYTESVKDLNEYAKEAEEAKDKYWSKEWKRQADDAEKVLNFLNTITESDIKNIKTVGGQVHEVDIPENPYLLDEQKSYREQSDFVKQAIQEIDRELQYPERKEKIFDNKDDAIDFYDSKIDEFEEKANGYQRFFPESFVTDDGKYGVKYVDDYTINEPLIGDYSEITGEGIYSRIARQLGSQKAASELLEKHGVKGITYFGKQDGRCFVIFNPADVKVIQKFYQGGKDKIKGSFDRLTKAIRITKNADFSTYPHEFAHFWLDNMWDYVQSGKASESYINQFNEIKKWLGVKSNQEYFTRAQHEKFARGYEKFLYEGKAINPIIASVFGDYERFIREVYDDISEIDVRAGKEYEPLSREAYDFFNSMVSGELTPPSYFPTETTEQARETVENSETQAKEFVAEESNILEKNRANYKLEPVKTDTKTSYLTAYEKMTGEKVEAGVVELEKEMDKAREFVENNLDLAEKIVNGEAPVPENMLKNTIYLAYEEIQKKLGNTDKRVNALLNQAQELRAYGQEIVSQKLAYADQSTPLYWISKVMSDRASAIAEGNKRTVAELQDFINKEVKPAIGDETAVENVIKKLKDELGIKELYQAEKPDFNSTKGVYKYVTSKLGIIPTQEESAEITKRADDMLSNLNNAQVNGNPSVDYFVKYKDLENYANSIAPSSNLRVLVSVIGKGNLLASFKSPLTNIVANTPVAGLQAALRRQHLGVTNSIVDPEFIRQNKKTSWEIYRKTGYQLNNMTDVSPKGMTLGEKITQSQGEGAIRKVGRIYENVIYKWSLGAPDLLYKDFAFNDYVSLAATKESGGDITKANEIYKDAVKIMPETELGQRIRQEAIEDSLISTYQNNGKISESALKIRKSLDFGIGFGEFIAPFVKTPANVVGMGLDTAFGSVRALTNEIVRDVRAGKVLTPKSENIRLVVQNGIGLLIASLLLGGIDDDDYMPSYSLATNKDKQLAKELNIPFNSIRIGDTWYSMDYLGPLASPLMGLLQARRENGIINSVMGYIKSGAIQTLSIPAFGNIGDLNEQITNIVRKDGVDALESIGSDVIQATVARSIPSIISDIAKVVDESDREAKTLKEKLMAKLPLLREELPEKYNITSGRIEPRAENTIKRVLMDLFAGARVKEQIVNSVADELFRLNTEGYGVSLTDVTRSGLLSKVDSDKKALIKRDFAKMYSNGVKELIKTSRYKNANNEDKKDMIDSLRRKYVKELKNKYLKKSKR